MAKCESIGLYFINEQLQNRKCQNSDVFKTTYQSPTNVFVLFIYHWGHWRTRADFGTMALAMTLVAKSVGKCFVDWCRLLQQSLASFKCIDAGKWCWQLLLMIPSGNQIWGFFAEFGACHGIGPEDHGCWAQEVEPPIAASGCRGSGDDTMLCHVVPTGKKMTQAWCITMYYYILLCITMYY